MTKVTITAEPSDSPDATFRAATGGRESVGRTPGAALDALVQQMDDRESNTLIVVQNMRPDEFFNAEQRKRLTELLAKRRTALDTGSQMADGDSAELESLIDAELEGATRRAEAIVGELRP